MISLGALLPASLCEVQTMLWHVVPQSSCLARHTGSGGVHGIGCTGLPWGVQALPLSASRGVL